MSNKKYKTINGLMAHLRNNHGITIGGSVSKRRLINHGYFHGYKGYRNAKSTPLPISDFEEIYQTILFDSKLKAILYEKLMFIETALKSIVTQSILDVTKSEEINSMFEKAIENFHTLGPNRTTKDRKDAQQKCLRVRNTVTSNINREYKKGNPIVNHYFENSSSTNNVPIWALIEILMLGDFGELVSSLTFNVRDSISKQLNINIGYDTNRICIYKSIYIFKDLRNAIAHNAVVYDARFLNTSINNAIKQCLINEFNLPFVNFKDIIDFIALIVFFQKKLHVSKKEQKQMLNKLEEMIDQFISKVGLNIAGPSFPNGWRQRIRLIRNNL